MLGDATASIEFTLGTGAPPAAPKGFVGCAIPGNGDGWLPTWALRPATAMPALNGLVGGTGAAQAGDPTAQPPGAAAPPKGLVDGTLSVLLAHGPTPMAAGTGELAFGMQPPGANGLVGAAGRMP
mmetsp:Transcript_55118/g.129029  ORF Transcript_55118/g.129029 Transcript_55118/m.129029 type:complete len:125 (-) Transcript_55118:1009-1383(-)